MSDLAPSVVSNGDFSGILRESQEFAQRDSSDRWSERLHRSFDRLMLQAGMPVAPSVLVMLCVYAAVTCGGGLYVAGENLLSTAIGATAGSLLPILIMLALRRRRQSQILAQLPGAIDELARAARTGRSIEQCLTAVLEDTEAPLRVELDHAARRIRMGISLGDSLRDLPHRTGVVATQVLVTALTVHQQTGGDLVGVLERLSNTIRSRATFLGRLRAVTAASRATALLMVGLPPLIVLFFVVRDPQYLTALFASTWSFRSTLLAIFLEIVGTVWVLRVLRNSQRV